MIDGNKVRALRQRDPQMTQMKLAILCDCSLTTISNIENDGETNCGVHLASALAKALGVPIEQLLAEKTS